MAESLPCGSSDQADVVFEQIAVRVLAFRSGPGRAFSEPLLATAPSVRRYVELHPAIVDNCTPVAMQSDGFFEVGDCGWTCR